MLAVQGITPACPTLFVLALWRRRKSCDATAPKQNDAVVLLLMELLPRAKHTLSIVAQMCCLGFTEVLLKSVAVFGRCGGELCATLGRSGCLAQCLQTRALLHVWSPKCFVSELSLDPLKAFFRSGLEFVPGFNTTLAEDHAVKMLS